MWALGVPDGGKEDAEEAEGAEVSQRKMGAHLYERYPMLGLGLRKPVSGTTLCQVRQRMGH